MNVLADWRIRELAREGMIEPFEERLVRNPQSPEVISCGLSSFGYDLRCAGGDEHEQCVRKEKTSAPDFQS